MPTTTDLDDLVRHLSGRGAKGRANPTPLDDPSGDAAQLLDEIRRRTRALLDDPPPGADPDRGRPGVGAAGRRIAPGVGSPWGPVPGSRRSTALLGLALLLLGAVLALATDHAWRRSERPRWDAGADHEVRQALAAIQARLAAPAPGSGPDPASARDQALADLNAQLAALNGRLAHQDRGGVAPGDANSPPTGGRGAAGDSAIAALGESLAAIRRDQASSEAATAGHIQEMRTLLQQVNTEVRRVLSRPEPTPSTNLVPILNLAIQALIHNLQHPSAQVRGEAVEQLASLGPPARTAIPALRERFNREPDQNVRAAIERVVGLLTSP